MVLILFIITITKPLKRQKVKQRKERRAIFAFFVRSFYFIINVILSIFIDWITIFFSYNDFIADIVYMFAIYSV